MTNEEWQMKNEKTGLRGVQWTIGAALVVAAANVGWIVGDAALAERMADALQFDRTALADGQLWRLVTCHLVHYSAGHFWIDLLPWVAIGLIYERRLGRLWPIATAAAMAAIGVGVWVGLPWMEYYRGWSGLDNTAMALAIWAAWGQTRASSTLARTANCDRAASGSSRTRWNRTTYTCAHAPASCRSRLGSAMLPRVLIVLVAIGWIGKISYEAFSGVPSFSHAAVGRMGEMVPLAHWLGAAAGAATIGAVAVVGRLRDLRLLVLVHC